jgi:hypothetical protein
MLDSGGAYGRNWERNRKRKFGKENPCIVEINSEYNEVNITFNVYHYLKTYLELNQATALLNHKFHKFCNLPANENKYYPELMKEFAEAIGTEVYTTNTYNYDNIISQTLQYTTFQYNEEQFILLQVHNGCDVRGGYTKPYIFHIDELDYFIMAQHDIQSGCANGHIWSSDDCGYHWYFDGSTAKSEYDWSTVNFTDDNKLLCKCGAEIKFNVSDCY